jgi:MFS family permease
LVKNYPGTALITFLIVVSGTATQSIVLFYLPTYAVTQLHMAVSASLASAIAGGLLVFITAPIGGVLSDRFGRKLVSQITRVSIALLVYPAFVVLRQAPTTFTLFSVFALLGALHGLNSGANGPMLAEAFPRHIRSTGMSVPYSLAVAIFGGFGPFIVTWLLGLTGNALMPAWYVVACAVPAIVGIRFLRDMTGETLD